MNRASPLVLPSGSPLPNPEGPSSETITGMYTETPTREKVNHMTGATQAGTPTRRTVPARRLAHATGEVKRGGIAVPGPLVGAIDVPLVMIVADGTTTVTATSTILLRGADAGGLPGNGNDVSRGATISNPRRITPRIEVTTGNGYTDTHATPLWTRAPWNLATPPWIHALQSPDTPPWIRAPQSPAIAPRAPFRVLQAPASLRVLQTPASLRVLQTPASLRVLQTPASPLSSGCS